MIIFAGIETTGAREDAPGALVLEIALVVADDDLAERGAVSAIIRPTVSREAFAASLGPVVLRAHEDSGLLDDVYEAGVSPHEVAEVLGQWLDHRERDLQFETAETPLGALDADFVRRWLRRYSLLDTRFAPESVDVGTIAELARRWSPSLFNRTPSRSPLRALPAAREAVSRLRRYRDGGLLDAGALGHLDALRATLAAERERGSAAVLAAAVGEAVVAAIRGEANSDFMESFPEVTEAAQLRQERDRAVAFVRDLCQGDERDFAQVLLNLGAEPETRAALGAIAEGHPPASMCPDSECLVCGYRACPKREPMHFHHDGCPARCGV